MKVKELIEILKDLDLEKEIGVDDECDSIVKIEGVNTHVFLPSGDVIYGIAIAWDDE